MITLHKILPVAVSPIVLVLLLVAASMRWRRQALAMLALALLWVASAPVVSQSLVRFVEGSQVVRLSPEQVEAAHAVVVLGGMSTTVRAGPPPPALIREWSEAADRFAAGVELFRAGKGARLVFTGGRLPWERLPETEGDWLRGQAIAQGVPAEAILVTGPVENTAQEAQAVAQMLPRGRIILVTSAFHMPRACALFEAQGLQVVPYPVDFRVPEQDMTVMDWLPSAEALKLTDMAWRELLGRAYYWVKVW